MKFTTKLATAGLATVLMTSTALAGGLERSTWSPSILFEDGTYIEGSYGNLDPDVTGSHFLLGTVSDINPDYIVIGGGIKFDLSDTLAIALTTYEPVGFDLAYPVPVNTTAVVDSRAYAISARMRANENLSLYGGLNYVSVKGSLDALNFAEDSDWGYHVGAAFEKKEIAMRIALTYESGTEHSLATTTGGFALGNTSAGMPEALTLEFQSGIAADTLLFGSIRYARHSGGDVILPVHPGLGALSGANLSGFSNTTTYNLGVGRKLNDRLSVFVAGHYEGGSGAPSNLNPTNGYKAVSTGFEFAVTENMDFSAGVKYFWIGDNQTINAPAGVPIAFKDNNALGYGMKVAFHF